MTEVKERKKPTPRNYDSILAGAKNLQLEERINLQNTLKNINEAELTERKIKWENASKLMNGNGTA